MKVNELMNLLSKEIPDTEVFFLVDKNIFQFDVTCIGTINNGNLKPEYKSLYYYNHMYIDWEELRELFLEDNIDIDKFTDGDLEVFFNGNQIVEITGLFITIEPAEI